MLSHVEALCRALNDKGDRQYCVHAWLKDQCPAEFIDDITITFSTVLEDKIRKPDALSDSIARLDKAASRNPELKRILSYLAELEDDPPDKSLRTSGERAPDSISA